MEYKPKLDRKAVQNAMKRPLFLLMDGSTIVPVLTLPIMFSWNYLKAMCVFYVLMSLISLTKRTPLEFFIHLLSKYNQGNNLPYRKNEIWKPDNR
ncbi:hypothetical protein DC852_06480 [Vibrio parahaemolyticus]|nr:MULTISPECIES: hypothetical protein [Vibrio harveyi group]APX09877.1 hypothetical protein BWP24_27065 [Vibrio campbellii]OOH98787.1 hypothetical protein BIW16_18420 [Vibrio sp. OULL4]ALR95694.1 hypothetical protein AT730_25990 [Vibrio alginolyticus]ARR10248.1 hypothetical protein Vc3S01_p20133 [Vibrio campbellii]EGR1442749.1 hypothetical protein [Vibrio parahaemolyticus]